MQLKNLAAGSLLEILTSRGFDLFGKAQECLIDVDVVKLLGPALIKSGLNQRLSVILGYKQYSEPVN